MSRQNQLFLALAALLLVSDYSAPNGNPVGADRRVGRTGIAMELAGDGIGDGGPAIKAALWPQAVAVAPDGTLYIAEVYHHRVRKVDSEGVITTVASTGPVEPWNGDYSGDGGPATQASLNQPHGVAVGPDGCLYIADTENNRIRKVDRNGIITTVAGSDAAGYARDGGPATKAVLNSPGGVAVGADGTVYIADTGNDRIRKVDPRGIITTLAGGGSPADRLGDGGRVTEGSLSRPRGVALDAHGSLYIADYGNRRVRKVDGKGIITTVAGDGHPGCSGDGGPATKASMELLTGVALAADGTVYIADPWNYRIRKVDPAGIITTVAGRGATGGIEAGAYSGDGGPATRARLNLPFAIAVGPDGSLYLADSFNGRIRKVDPDGVITTVAGSGDRGD